MSILNNLSTALSNIQAAKQALVKQVAIPSVGNSTINQFPPLSSADIALHHIRLESHAYKELILRLENELSDLKKELSIHEQMAPLHSVYEGHNSGEFGEIIYYVNPEYEEHIKQQRILEQKIKDIEERLNNIYEEVTYLQSLNPKLTPEQELSKEYKGAP